MAPKAETTVITKGLAPLLHELTTLTDRLQRKYIRQAVAASGRVIITAARGNLRARGTRGKRINKRTGKRIKGLAMSMKARPTSQWRSSASLAKRGIIGAAIGFEWPVGAHAHLVEFGHRMVTSKKAGHRDIGFVPPHPFFRPAIEATKGRVRSEFMSKIGAGLKREAKESLKRIRRSNG